MNKRIFLIPLITTLLFSTGCSKSGSKKKKSVSDSSIEEPEEETTSSATAKPRAETVEEGSEHPLPWTLDYDSFKDPGNSPSYYAYNKTYEFDGTNVYCYGMRAVTDISVNVNGSLVPYGGFKIIHFCKVGHEKFPDGGQIQISDLKPATLTVEIISNNRYRYSASTAPSVYVGNKKAMTPSTPITTVSPIHKEFNVYTITYELNATEAGVIKIKNEQSFSMYLQSLQFA